MEYGIALFIFGVHMHLGIQMLATDTGQPQVYFLNRVTEWLRACQVG